MNSAYERRGFEGLELACLSVLFDDGLAVPGCSDEGGVPGTQGWLGVCLSACAWVSMLESLNDGTG